MYRRLRGSVLLLSKSKRPRYPSTRAGSEERRRGLRIPWGSNYQAEVTWLAWRWTSTQCSCKDSVRAIRCCCQVISFFQRYVHNFPCVRIDRLPLLFGSVYKQPHYSFLWINNLSQITSSSHYSRWFVRRPSQWWVMFNLILTFQD
jgi:hypothetical protein